MRLLPRSEPPPERHERTLAYLSKFAPNGGGEDELLARIQSAVILVAGVSGLGSWIAVGLALLGVGELRLVDSDVVRGSNLHQTLLLHESDVGRDNVSALAQRLTASSSSTKTVTFTHDLAVDALPLCVIDGADVVISAASEPEWAIRRLIAQACIPRGIPFVCPSDNRVGPFYVGPGTACVLCEHAELIDRNAREELGRLPPSQSGSVPHIATAAAAIVLQDKLRVITGIKPPATKNHVWIADANLEATRVPRPSYVGCPACHPCVDAI